MCVCRNEIRISHEFNDFLTPFPGGQVISYASYEQLAFAHHSHRVQGNGRIAGLGAELLLCILPIEAPCYRQKLSLLSNFAQ